MRRTGQPDPFVTAAKELGASVKETARKNKLDAVAPPLFLNALGLT
jgi:hypothetical protein